MFDKYKNKLKNSLIKSLPKTIEGKFLSAKPPKGLFSSCKIMIMVDYEVKDFTLFRDDAEKIQSYERADPIKLHKGFFNDYKLINV